MNDARMQRIHGETGLALLVAVVMLLLISAIGLTALQNAQDEATGSGRARRKTATLLAAQSALQIVEQNLDINNKQYPDTNPINLPTFLSDQWGGNTSVRTGTSDTSTPQAIQALGTTPGEGGQLNVNSANSLSYGIYRANVVATDPGGGMVELQSQYSVSQGASGYK